MQLQVKSNKDHAVKGENDLFNDYTCLFLIIQIILCIFPQMADCGGLPQVVQVSVCACKFFQLNCIKWSYLCLQPGKLAEAFKYFVQGMGYSKYSWPYVLSVSSSNETWYWSKWAAVTFHIKRIMFTCWTGVFVVETSCWREGGPSVLLSTRPFWGLVCNQQSLKKAVYRPGRSLSHSLEVHVVSSLFSAACGHCRFE